MDLFVSVAIRLFFSIEAFRWVNFGNEGMLDSELVICGFLLSA